MGIGYSQRELGLSKEREAGVVVREIGIELGFLGKEGTCCATSREIKGIMDQGVRLR